MCVFFGEVQKQGVSAWSDKETWTMGEGWFGMWYQNSSKISHFRNYARNLPSNSMVIRGVRGRGPIMDWPLLLFYDVTMYTKTLGQGEIASQTSWTDTACCLSEKGRLTQSSVNFIHLFQLFGDPDMMKTEGWWSNKENPQRTAFAGVTNDWPVNKKKKKVSRHLFHQGLSLEILNLSVVILYNGLSH